MHLAIAHRRHIPKKILVPKLQRNFLINTHEILRRSREVSPPPRHLRNRPESPRRAFEIGPSSRRSLRRGRRHRRFKRRVVIPALVLFRPRPALGFLAFKISKLAAKRHSKN